MRTATSLLSADRARHRDATPRHDTSSRVSSYALYVGRVGALAVALGIGAAVASTPGVAWADGEPTPTPVHNDPGPENTDAGLQSTASPDTAPSSQHPDLGQIINHTLQHTADAVRKVVTGVVTSTGGAHSSTYGTTTSSTNDNSTVASSTAGVQSARQQKVSRNDPPAATSAPPSLAPQQLPHAVSSVVTRTRHAARDAAAALRDVTDQVAAPRIPASHTTDINKNAAGFNTAAVDASPQVTAAEAQPNPVVRVVSGLLAAIGIAPGASNRPIAPISPLTLLGGLQLIRRELEHTFNNQAPQLPSGTTSLITDNQHPVALPGLPATDADGDAVTYSAPAQGQPGGPKHGTVTVVDNHVTYTPDVGYVGDDSFTLTASDVRAANGVHIHGLASLFNPAAAHTDTEVVTVHVANGHVDPPTVPPGQSPYTTEPRHSDDPAGTVRGTIHTTDPQGLPVTYSYTGTNPTPDGSTFSVQPDGSFVYNPSDAARHAAAGTGPTTATFTVAATNSSGASAPIVVNLPIDSANEPLQAPTTPPPSTVVDESGKVTGRFGYTDPDDDTITYTGPASERTAAGGTITVGDDGTYTYTPTAEQRHAAAGTGPTTDTFDVTIADGHGSTQTATITVPIDAANATPQAPTDPPPSSVTHTDGTVSSHVGYTDADNDGLTYTGPTNGPTAGGGLVTVYSNGTYIYKPTTEQRLAAYSTAGADTDTFYVTIQDGHGSTQTVPVTVKIDAAGAAVTSTTSTAGTSSGKFVGPDGTTYDIVRTGAGTADSPYRSTVTITNPDGMNATTSPIPGYSYFGVTTSKDGTRTLTTYDGSATRVTEIHSDGTTVTSAPSTGMPFGAPVVGSGGTIVQEVYDGSGTVDDPYRTSIIVLRPDGSTIVSPPVHRTSFQNDQAVVVGADGTVAKTFVVGSGTDADPYQSSILVIHPNADGSTTTTFSTPIDGQAEGTVVGADGTVGVTTKPARASESDPYQTHGVVVHPDGSQTSFTMDSDSSYWSDPANRLSIGADGTAAASNPNGLVTVVSPNGTTKLVSVPPYEIPTVGGDGSVYVSGYVSGEGFVTTVIHPDGSPDTTLPGYVAVASDGTAYHTASTTSGAVTQTVVKAIRADGTTTTVATIDGTPSRSVQFGPDGTPYQVTYATSGGVTRTTVTALRPGAASAPVATVDGTPYGLLEFGSDGTLYQVAYDQTTNKSALAAYSPSEGTSRTSASIDGIPRGNYQASGYDRYVTSNADGTAAFTALTANTTTLAVLRPDGSTDVAPPAAIAGNSSYSPVIRPDGTVYQLIGNNSQTALSVIRPDGGAATSTPVTGYPTNNVLFGPDGSAAFGTYTYNGPVASRLTVVRQDGTTITTDPVDGSGGQIAFGSDGTAAMVSGTSVAVIHANNDTTTTDPVDDYSGSSIVISDTGTVYQAITSYNPYKTIVVVVGPDGTTSDPIVLDGVASQPVLGPNGVAYVPTQSYSPYESTVTVVRPDGTYTTAPPVADSGRSYDGIVVDHDSGSVYDTTYNFGDYSNGNRYRTTVRIFRSNGDINTVTMDGYPTGGVVIAPDGTVTQTTFDSVSDTTTVNTITVAPQPPPITV